MPDPTASASTLPPWLSDAMATDHVLPATVIVVRLAFALACGAAIALIYRLSHGSESRDSKAITATLILLAALIAMVSMVIGSNVARAFSLVGALSIVRFRTVVEDTRDTAFVIFAVIAGMATGCGLLLVPTLGIPVVGAAAIGLSAASRHRANGNSGAATLVVRVGLGHDPHAILRDALLGHLLDYRLVETGTARQGSALEVTYRVHLRSATNPTPLIAALNAIDGVQGVELRLASS